MLGAATALAAYYGNVPDHYIQDVANMPKAYTKRRAYRSRTSHPSYGVGKTSRRRYTDNVSKTDMLRMLNRRTGGFVGKELKFHDTKSNVNLVKSSTATGLEVDPATTLCLNAMVQGTGPTERIGRRIWMKSIQIEGHVAFPGQTLQTAPNIDHVCTIWIVLDTQTNKAQAQSEQVFTNVAALTTMTPYLYRNMENTDRFRILKKKTIRMRTDVTSEGAIADPPKYAHSGQRVPFKMFIYLKKLTTLFDPASTLGTISQVMDNSLHVMAGVSDTGGVPIIDYQARLRFWT